MPILNKPTSAARMSLAYITVGALLTVWTVIWYTYLRNNPPNNEALFYVCAGLLFTGLTLLGIGFFLGQIGRAARHAELPPPEVTPQVENAEQMAAARAPVVAAGNPAMPTTNGTAMPAANLAGPPVSGVAAAAPTSRPVRPA